LWRKAVEWRRWIHCKIPTIVATWTREMCTLYLRDVDPNPVLWCRDPDENEPDPEDEA
jgi:hypothetical protein